MLLDGFVSGRDIVAGLRAELSDLDGGQRVAFGREQIDALAQCPVNLMRVPPEDLLPAWQALQTAFRFEYVAGFIRDVVPRDVVRWFLIRATDLNAEAATLFDKAGARLMADVIVPHAVIEKIARHRPEGQRADPSPSLATNRGGK